MPMKSTESQPGKTHNVPAPKGLLIQGVRMQRAESCHRLVRIKDTCLYGGLCMLLMTGLLNTEWNVPGCDGIGFELQELGSQDRPISISLRPSRDT